MGWVEAEACGMFIIVEGIQSALKWWRVGIGEERSQLSEGKGSTILTNGPTIVGCLPGWRG
jgi:hypothetical protein